MAWHWPGDKPLCEPMMVSLLMHICPTWPVWVKKHLFVLMFQLASQWWVSQVCGPSWPRRAAAPAWQRCGDGAWPSTSAYGSVRAWHCLISRKLSIASKQKWNQRAEAHFSITTFVPWLDIHFRQAWDSVVFVMRIRLLIRGHLHILKQCWK